MFVVIDNIAKHVGEVIGALLLAAGQGRKATAREAAECVGRLIVNGDERMGDANAEFEHTYGSFSRRVPTNPQTYADRGMDL